MHFSRIKSVAVLLTAALLAACLSGCVAEIGTVSINEDLSGTIEAKVGYTKEAIEQMSGMSEETPDLSEMETFEYNGVTYYGESETATFANLDELNKFLNSSSEETSAPVASGVFSFSAPKSGTVNLTVEFAAKASDTEATDTEGFISGDIEDLEELSDGIVEVFDIMFPYPVKQVSGGSKGVVIAGSKLSLDFIEMSSDIDGNKGATFSFVASNDPSIVSPVAFSDVQQGKWYYAAVMKMAVAGVVNGMGDGRFAPEDQITYAQFCNMLAKAWGLEYGEKNGYWAEKAIESCLAEHFIESRGDVSRANYDAPITREAAISAVARAFGAQMNLEKQYDVTSVPDYEEISEAYRGDVLRAYNTGITEGMDSAHTFSPKTFLTRAQVCQLFLNVGVGA